MVHVWSLTSQGHWLLVQLLTSDVTDGSDLYGLHVVMVADVLAVAAPAAGGQGCVYIYHRLPNSRFVLTATARGDGTAGEEFGASLVLYKAPMYRLIVGAPGHDDSRGGAYMVLIDPAASHANVSEVLVRSDGHPGDRFGSIVSGFCTLPLLLPLAA